MKSVLFILLSGVAVSVLSGEKQIYDIQSDTGEYDPVTVENHDPELSSAAADFAKYQLQQVSLNRKERQKLVFEYLKKHPGSVDFAIAFFFATGAQEFSEYSKELLSLAEKHPENPVLISHAVALLVKKAHEKELARLLANSLRWYISSKENFSEKYKRHWDFLFANMIYFLPEKEWEGIDLDEIIEAFREDPRFNTRLVIMQSTALYFLKTGKTASDKKPFSLGWETMSDKEKAQEAFQTDFAKSLQLLKKGEKQQVNFFFTEQFLTQLKNFRKKEECNKLVSVLPTVIYHNHDALRILANEYFDRQDFTRSELYGIGEFELAKGKIPFFSRVRLGKTLFLNKKYKFAAAVLQTCILKDQNNSYIYALIANCYCELKNYKKALEYMKKCPDTLENQLFCAALRLELGETAGISDLLAEFEKKLPPKDSHRSGLITLYARLAQKTNDYTRFDEVYPEYLKNFPDDDNAMNTLGYTWAERGVRLDEAEKLIRSAIKKSKGPVPAAYLDSLAWVLYRKNKYTDAQNWIIKAVISSKKPSGEIFDHAGDIFLKCNEVESALLFWEKALKCNDEEIDKKRIRAKIQKYNR